MMRMQCNAIYKQYIHGQENSFMIFISFTFTITLTLQTLLCIMNSSQVYYLVLPPHCSKKKELTPSDGLSTSTSRRILILHGLELCMKWNWNVILPLQLPSSICMAWYIYTIQTFAMKSLHPSVTNGRWKWICWRLS